MGFFTVLLSAIMVVALIVWFVWATWEDDEAYGDEND